MSPTALTFALLTVLAQPGGEAPAPAKPAGRYWTTNWSFEDVDVGKLTRRLGAIGIELGVPVDGRVSVQFRVGVPMASLRDAAAYRVDGIVTSPNLQIDGLRLSEFESTIRYRDGTLNVSGLEGRLGRGGKFAADGSAQLVPRGTAQINAKVDSIDLQPILDLVGGELPVTGGEVTGTASFSGPVDKISDLSTIQLNAAVDGRGLIVDGLPPLGLHAGTVRLSGGVLTLDDVDAQAPGRQPIRLSGSARIPVAVPKGGDQRATFDIRGDDVPTAAVLALASGSDGSGRSAVEGKVDLIAKGSGRLDDPASWQLDAAVASPSLRVVGVDLGTIEHDVRVADGTIELKPRGNADLDDLIIGDLSLRIVSGEDATRVEDLAGQLFGGQIAGSASLAADDSGTHTIDLRFDGISPRWTSPTGPRVTATASGRVDWRVPAAEVERLAAHRGTANLKLDRIILGNEPVGDLAVQLSADAGDLELAGSGTLFGGKVTVAGDASAEATDTLADLPARARNVELAIDGVSIAPLVPYLLSARVSDRLSLAGTFSGRVKLAAADPPSVSFEIQTDDLTHRGRVFSRAATVTGRVDAGGLELTDVRGDYAGGQIIAYGEIDRLAGQVDADAFSPNIQVRLSHVNLETGLWFLGPTATYYQGTASAMFRLGGTLASLRMVGNLEGQELLLFGVPADTAHSDFRLTAGVGQRWRVKLDRVEGQTAGGQITGEVAVSQSTAVGGVDLSSQFRGRRVDFVRLTSQLGRPVSVASGTVTGTARIGGRGVRGLRDLNGSFDFRLGQTRGAAVPGLIAASRFLGPLSLATTRFDRGEASGILSSGAVIFDEVTLVSDSALVRADGQVFLPSGRLNLGLFVATGSNGLLQLNLQRIAQRVALQAIIPLPVIFEVADLFQNRALVLDVRGTLRNPIVRLDPAETFREESVRFLIREAQRAVAGGIGASVYEDD